MSSSCEPRTVLSAARGPSRLVVTEASRRGHRRFPPSHPCGYGTRLRPRAWWRHSTGETPGSLVRRPHP